MKKNLTNALLIVLLIAFSTKLHSQVTIGDGIEPQDFSILEISTLSTKGGIRLPQLTSIEKLGLSLDTITNAEKRDKALGLLVYDITTNSVEYWDGVRWERLDIVSPWRVSNHEVHGDSIPTRNNQDIFQMGRVSVGTSNGDPSAAFNVASKNKGVLLPRVTLKSTTDTVTIANPAEGLLVYNTGNDTNFNITGFFYWNGTTWMRFTDRAAIAPKIDALLCNNAQLTPSRYQINKQYEGILEIPYTGGNGGSYSEGTKLGPINGLYYTLQAGTLENGNGRITYTISGTPTVSSPVQTEFPIDFLGKNCTSKVGHGGANIETRTYLGPMTPVSQGAEFAVTTLDGRYSLRFFAKNTENLDYTDIQIKHNGTVYPDKDNIIIMHTVFFHGSLSSSFGNSDNNFEVTQNWKIHGDPDVYYLGRPEYRQLIFTPTDNTGKMYRYTFFFGAPKNKFSNYPDTKCWIHAEEITTE